MGIYQWLWERIGGEPWSHIIRNSAGWSALVVGALVVVNAVAYKKVKRKSVFAAITGVSGAIIGHLYW